MQFEAASEACDQAVLDNTVREQTSEATMKCAECGSPNYHIFLCLHYQSL